MSKPTTETKKYKNIDMFKRADVSPHNDGCWKVPFEDEFDIEVKGNKARVYSNNPWAKKPSRYCKLTKVKDVPNSNKSVFQLTVNGCQAFFTIALNLKN